MSQLTTAQQLTKIKAALGIGEGIPDATLEVWLSDVKDFMLNAGVPNSVINSDTTIGTLARGVSDIWNYGDTASYSQVFIMRVSQLALGVKK